MNIWLLSDTHFGHDRLVDFGRPVDFDEKIRKNILENVHKGDLVIHLGDVCIGNDRLWNNWLKENVGCRTVLVRGNHDRKSNTFYLQNGWDMVTDRFDLVAFGKRITFSHIPLPWDGFFDVNIHGHLHDVGHECLRHGGIKLNGYNKLFALEANGYMPEKLDKFLGRK